MESFPHVSCYFTSFCLCLCHSTSLKFLCPLHSICPHFTFPSCLAPTHKLYLSYHLYIGLAIPSYWPHCIDMYSWYSIPASCTRDMGLIPESERSPGVGNGNLFQYSCLKISMVRGAWQTTVHKVAISQKQLSMHIPKSTFLHMTRMQGPDHFLPGSFLRVMFTVSRREERNKLSLQDKEYICLLLPTE